jgi:hypothetical protein
MLCFASLIEELELLVKLLFLIVNLESEMLYSRNEGRQGVASKPYYVLWVA